MKQNIGLLDKIIRLFIALIIFSLGFFYHSYWGFIGLVPLLTALSGWCPLYSLLGLSTQSKEKQLNPQSK